MKAHIITIGNELLIGDIVNTNASWIGSTLTQSGIQVEKVVTVGDDHADITESLDQSLQLADLVILTGGLGPTHDDITKKTVVDYFGSNLITHEPTLEHVKKIFDKRGLPFTKSNYGQAMVPDNAEVLFNKWGTAPGILFHKDGHIVVVLPGVPHEMKALILDKLLPRLKRSERGEGVYKVYYFQLAGIGESTLSDVVIGDIRHMFNGRMTMAYLPHTWGITLRISCYAGDEKEAEWALEPVKEHIRRTASEYIYSESMDVGLSSVIGSLLRSGGATLSTAESCTGGLLAGRITDVPG
ncbi:MAG TPA: molybdopterin-binding protein, partial [Balneolales bacterium]|nr:molybdopterin-binding protein [Balneolales bacterium]